MYFSKVEISQFRNLVSTSFSPSSSLNLIFGANGSGKSSLLEALHYLLTGSSFRTHRANHIINSNTDCFTLFCLLEGANSHRIGLERCRSLSNKTRIDGRDASRRSDLLQLAPLQVISPESLTLITEGSEYRRNFIDWGLFHVEHSFYHHLSHYHRGLKQRNALLRSESLNSLHQWDSILVQHGVEIDRLRREYIEMLSNRAKSLLSNLLPEVEIQLHYRSGWAQGIELSEALLLARDNDQRNHHTTVGPHRGDVIVKSDGTKIIDLLSRGQLKLVTLALKLAQTLHLQESTNKKPIILVDDMAAELDPNHRELLIHTLQSLGIQLFVTTPDISLIPSCGWSEIKVFHVEHGKIKEVV